MQSFALFFKASKGTFDDGRTVSDDPIATNRSQVAACWNACDNAILGNFSPKYIIESIRSPPQFSHFLPVKCILLYSEVVPLLIVLKSLKYSLLHSTHFYKFLFPCNSAILLLLTPDLKCKPSVFCDTKYLNIFFYSNVFMPMWVNDGTALSTIWSILSFGGLSLVSRFQMPGPVETTVFKPER